MKEKFNKIKDKINLKMIAIFTFVLGLLGSTPSVYAVEKIEGGNITIDSLGTIIKNLATKVQVFIGDDETKQRRKKTILYTLGGVALLILVPSIINFVIDTLK